MPFYLPAILIIFLLFIKKLNGNPLDLFYLFLFFQLFVPNLVANATQYQEIDGLETMKAEDSSSSRQSEASDHEEMKKMNNHSDKVVCTFSREEPSIWIDGYICSLCGFELPPSFIEERQEHADYHFAEMLQKEESINSYSRDLVQKQR